MTDKPGSLAEALADLQSNLPPIGKDATAQYGRYADLADVTKALMPELGKRGLSFTCTPSLLWHLNEDVPHGSVALPEPSFVLTYTLRHVSGDQISGRYPLPAGGTPQAIGSAITYARRYALCAVTGAVADEDDDGQAAEKAAAPAKRRRESPPVRPATELPRNRDGSVSRSRSTDAELDASGQMTDAQIREHGRLERDVKGSGPQGTERLDQTPDDDPWYQEPPTPVRAPRAAQDPARTIAMHFARLGVDDRDVRLGYTAQLARRDQLASTKDLTAAEGMTVLAALGRCKDQPALLALLEEPAL